MKLKNVTASVQAMTIVRLIVLVISIVNLVLSVFGSYQIPGLSESTQEALAVIITIIVSFVSYWYNNSWSKNATTADKLLTMLKETDVTVDEVLDFIEDLQNSIESRKEGGGGSAGGEPSE